ncbi:SDR family oxidoreductase [Hyphobacterium sp.]|uniref:SDR family oxidoreductase n=1 Tax=Hyphobacterium sp. TaxID=2004662 RepID=UPI003BAA9343
MKILLTGASSGFGRLFTQSLIADGHEVAASMRGASGKNKPAAEDLEKLGATIAEIDVTDDDSVTSGTQAAIEALGGLDVLINNAGVGVNGVTEAFTADDLHRLFDVNVYGVQRMNRAVLPTFRSQGSGLLVHISSLLGRITLPYYGPYNASKWALEALAENYRTELSGFGIESVLIEPGGFPTEFGANLLSPSDADRERQYGGFAEAKTAAGERFAELLAANPQQDPQIVADAVRDLIAMPRGKRPFRTPVDKIGMGDPVVGYNDYAAKITKGIYGNMGLGDLLKLAD